MCLFAVELIGPTPSYYSACVLATLATLARPPASPIRPLWTSIIAQLTYTVYIRRYWRGVEQH